MCAVLWVGLLAAYGLLHLHQLFCWFVPKERKGVGQDLGTNLCLCCGDPPPLAHSSPYAFPLPALEFLQISPFLPATNVPTSAQLLGATEVSAAALTVCARGVKVCNSVLAFTLLQKLSLSEALLRIRGDPTRLIEKAKDLFLWWWWLVAGDSITQVK